MATPWGAITPEQRFGQTMLTLQSIKEHDPQALIVLVDNSSQPLNSEWVSTICGTVDHWLSVGGERPHRLFNSMAIKGAGEARMILSALDLLSVRSTPVHRLFKISGRYRLSRQFSLEQFDHPKHWVFKNRHWSWTTQRTALHTRMWSACGSLMSATQELIQTAGMLHLTQGITLEEAMFSSIDLSALKELRNLNVEGQLAETKTWVQD
jgi:hypothetical protein